MFAVILLDLESDDVGIDTVTLHDSYEAADQFATDICRTFDYVRGVDIHVSSVSPTL